MDGNVDRYYRYSKGNDSSLYYVYMYFCFKYICTIHISRFDEIRMMFPQRKTYDASLFEVEYVQPVLFVFQIGLARAYIHKYNVVVVGSSVFNQIGCHREIYEFKHSTRTKSVIVLPTLEFERGSFRNIGLHQGK